MQKQIKRKKLRGVLTVELTLIFPVIFLGMMAVMYMSIIQYQNVINAAAVMQSANRIAAYWPYIGDGSAAMLNPSAETSAASLLHVSYFANNDPYRNLYDGNRGNRLSAGQNYANSLIGALPSFYESESAAEIRVQKTGNFLIPNITVSVEKHYVNPFGQGFQQFGIGNKVDSIVKTTAPLTSDAEFVRNIDFVQEMIEKHKNG